MAPVQALGREDFELDYHSETLVLGIGNLLWADEGFGVRASERCTPAGSSRRTPICDGWRHAGSIPAAVCAEG
jgi:hypothetical protein